MANNFSQADATLANNNLTTIVSATSNKQIVIGLLISNTGFIQVLYKNRSKIRQSIKKLYGLSD